MRAWHLAGTASAAAGVLAGLLVAPGASAAPASGATHPKHSLVVIALDYGGAIIGASNKPVLLPALRRGVITASLSDYAYLHYTLRSDLGGFVPAPVGRFVAVAPVRLSVAGATHSAQIPLYAKTNGVAGNAVQAFAFQGGQATSSSTTPSTSTANRSLPTTTGPTVTSSSSPASTSTTAQRGPSTSTTTGRAGGAGGAPAAGLPPTPTSGTGAPQTTTGVPAASTTTSSLIPGRGTTTTTSAPGGGTTTTAPGGGGGTTTTLAGGKHPTTTTTTTTSPRPTTTSSSTTTSSTTTSPRPSAPPTNTTTTRPTTTTSASTTTTSGAPVTTTTAPAGTVEMTNNHDGHSFLNATNMAPGSSSSDTVTIGNVGTAGFELTLEPTTSTNGLARALNLAITMDSSPRTVEYDGLLANVPASLPIERLAAGASTTFTFTLSLPTSAGNDLQNQSAQLDLTWVGQN
ncbi:MAG: hypothetical protein M0004_12535 [Actinomycetota bacterium]|nr:hypothetical protein [Actinomycetota bacterium]